MIKAHLGPIWYHSKPSDVPYSPNQFLGSDFFAVSYSKPALVANRFVKWSTIRDLVVCKYFFKFACPDMKFLNPYHISRYTLTFNICIRTKVEVDQSKAKVGQKVSTSKTSIDHTKSCLKQN